MAQDKRKQARRNNDNNAFIGEGTIVHADHETLCETTELSEREIYAFATNDVRRMALNPKRKMRVGQYFIHQVMLYKKSLGGRGIDDIKQLYQVTNEEKQVEQQKGAYFA